MNDATKALEPGCPYCRSCHYARCDERREDGKWHSGSILRCIECKTTYLDPALAASPEVAALIREAEARGMERAAGMTSICAADAKNDPGTGWASHSWLMTVCRILEAEAAALRGEKEPK